MLGNGSYFDLSVYCVKTAEELTLQFKGSKEDRRRQFLEYILPILAPYGNRFGTCYGDDEDSLQEWAGYLSDEADDFIGCATLSEWCKTSGHTALVWVDCYAEPNSYSVPQWSESCKFTKNEA